MFTYRSIKITLSIVCIQAVETTTSWWFIHFIAQESLDVIVWSFNILFRCLDVVIQSLKLTLHNVEGYYHFQHSHIFLCHLYDLERLAYCWTYNIWKGLHIIVMNKLEIVTWMAMWLCKIPFRYAFTNTPYVRELNNLTTCRCGRASTYLG